MTDITIENFTEFPVGTKVTFNFGAGYPPCEGTVTGHEILAATKWFPANVFLLANYYDPEQDEFIETRITRFTESGIGSYLNEPVILTEKNTNSPWYQET